MSKAFESNDDKLNKWGKIHKPHFYSYKDNKLQIANYYVHKIFNIPNFIMNMDNLVDLDITMNIEHIPDNIGNLINLKYLAIDCAHNYQSPVSNIPNSLFNLINLECLCILYTSITNIPKDIIKLQKLKICLLSNNLITDIPDEIYEIHNLGFINLYGNPMSESKVKFIENKVKFNYEFNKLLK